jgi:hypothetical protein
MIIVAIPKAMVTGTLDPMVKKWCSHTVKLITEMLMLAMTSEV